MDRRGKTRCEQDFSLSLLSFLLDPARQANGEGKDDYVGRQRKSREAEKLFSAVGR